MCPVVSRNIKLKIANQHFKRIKNNKKKKENAIKQNPIPFLHRVRLLPFFNFESIGNEDFTTGVRTKMECENMRKKLAGGRTRERQREMK